MNVRDIKTSEGRIQLATHHPSGRQLLIPSPLQTVVPNESIVNLQMVQSDDVEVVR